jgi:hypothetical protein
VRGFRSGKLRYLCLEKYIAAGSTAMKMSCGLGSSCCDELRPAKKALRAGQLDESGLCILRHSSGSDQLKKCRKLNEPSGDQEHDGDGNATVA